MNSDKNELPVIAGGKPSLTNPIPLHRPWCGADELAEIEAAFEQGWLTTGPRTHQFESEFKLYRESAWAVGTNSCTAALHLSLIIAGVKPGDEVLLPTMTFPSTANCVVHCGATPVFCDVMNDTWCLDSEDARNRTTKKTKAVIPVHLAGVPVDLDAIHSWADPQGITVIEDAAHAVETEYEGRKVGSISRFTAFSFYATKNITTGEGGMVLGTNPDDEKAIRHWGNHGISSDAYNREGSAHLAVYELEHPGYKYNMSDIVAAMGLHQLRRIEFFAQRRSGIIQVYQHELGKRDDLVFQTCHARDKSANHLAIIKLQLENLKASRDEIGMALQAEGLGMGVHFRPVHKLLYYRERQENANLSLPTAEELGRSVLSLPLYPRMSNEEASEAACVVNKVLDYYHK